MTQPSNQIHIEKHRQGDRKAKIVFIVTTSLLGIVALIISVYALIPAMLSALIELMG